AEVDDHARLREVERKHIATTPDGEREEIRQILQSKGLTGAALEDAVAAITSNEETWIETMLTEEYGLSPVLRKPLFSGASTFAAFLICGAVPLFPYLFGVEAAFSIAIAMTAAVFFGIGALKARWSLATWWASGLETLGVGMLAAAAAFAVGYLLRDLV
ncbi:MAG: hypothetical protein HKN05_12795, partial [Rhizobiales bacterium]|nr:hypothetical protein [Hyphomicrobiales bacterium]